MQSLIKSTAYQRGIAPIYKKKKFREADSVFAQSAVDVYFHICVKMLLSKFFGGRGDKVFHLISFFCLFSNLLSVSECLRSGKNRQCCMRGSCHLTSCIPVSGEGEVLNKEVDLRKVGRDGKRKRERGRLGEHRFESRGDD